ncbi:hypothetical protein LCGC14_2299020, partial [marine sediment metagenome]
NTAVITPSATIDLVDSVARGEAMFLQVKDLQPVNLIWENGLLVTAERLLAHLEEYEYTGLASDAWQVANDFRGLYWSAPEEADRLSRQLHTHYRNANVRVAIAGPLLDRMIPQPGRIDAPVRDRVVNVPVRGNTSTFTELSVQLIPDARRIRLGPAASIAIRFAAIQF